MDRGSIRKFAEAANRIERRKAERLVRISKRLKPGSTFRTGTGKVNTILEVSRSHLFFRAALGSKVVSLSKDVLARLFAYFTRVRIVERKELEVFCKFNSALFGLLSAVFEGKARLGRAGNLLRLILLGVRVFLAGGEKCPSEISLAAGAGAKYVLFSYYWIRNRKSWISYLRKNNLKCILDCGSFSEWVARKKGKRVRSLDIDEYIDFIKRHQGLIDYYFVQDVIGDHGQTMRNLRYMESAGLHPIPIFHMGTDMFELDCLVAEGYPVIGLGGTVNQKGRFAFFNEVFSRHPGQAFHGLGVTKAEYVFSFPFYSCDSTAWLQCRLDDVLLTRWGQYKRPDLSVAERLIQSVKFLKSIEIPGLYRRIIRGEI